MTGHGAYTVVAEGLAFPEGPLLLPDGDLAVVEIAGERLTRIGRDGRKHEISRLPGGPNGAAIGPDGRIYVCNNGGFAWVRQEGILRPNGPAAGFTGGWIERIDPETGKVERLLSEVEGLPLTGPNDIVFDRHGGFWFTDHGKKHGRTMDLGAVYYVSDGLARRVAFPLLGPNGIGLSPGESELYVAETATGRLWAYTIVAPGRLAESNWLSPTGGRLVCGLPGFQRYDSLAVEADGTISIACLREGGIVSVRPDGSLVRRVATDDPYTTNLCFGADDLKTAYITLSGTGRLVSMLWPSQGLRLNFT
jgi:gluconolactonase